jgi:exodeoxyribonuclease V alpha subunit
MWYEFSSSDSTVRHLAEQVRTGYARYCTAKTPAEALEALNGFRILCALRRGPLGSESVNRLVERVLMQAAMLSPAPGFYHRQPVMVTENDYGLHLYNGDTGVVFTSQGNMRAYFPGADGSLRVFPPHRLPRTETAFSLTVHKSQGSEFGSVLLLLPATDSPVLSRELLYTGISRAREHVAVWGGEPALRAAVGRPTVRTSGLRDRLWGSS